MEEIIMEKKSGNEKTLVFSYLQLRKAIGILGIALPFVVSIGAWIFFQTGLKGSLSAYYHSGMRDVFVGIMIAYGFFLLSYKGHESKDNIAATLACIFACAVALFPTPAGGSVTTCERIIGIIHFISAAAFFLTLIYFCLCLFTKTNPDKEPNKKKKQRNKVYRICGYGMLTCILLIGIIYILPGSVTSFLKGCKPIFWLESFAIFCFGFSWFTKGEAILKDVVEPSE
jgi:FtsH-binding integral membrane protein